MCRAIHTRTVAIDWTEKVVEDEHFYLTLSHLVLTCVMLLLNGLADKITDQQFLQSRKPCPNYEASFLNKILYVWCTPLLWAGYRRPLSMSDLWDISPKIASKFVVPEFAVNYDSDVKKFKEEATALLQTGGFQLYKIMLLAKYTP